MIKGFFSIAFRTIIAAAASVSAITMNEWTGSISNDIFTWYSFIVKG